LAALANYESGDTNQPSVLRWDFDGGALKPGAPLPSLGSSPSALALGDVDGDGQPELFVGGRVNIRRWPEPATSKLFHNTAGAFSEDMANSRALEHVGLVTGAVFADLDGDGKPDLVLATEFGPVRVFRNRSGALVEVTKELGLDGMVGRWSCVGVGDFDGDGRTDLIVGNWGLNSTWQVWGDHLPRIAWGDFNGDGSIGVIESVRVGQQLMPWRDRDFLGSAIADLPARFPTHTAFTEATLTQVLGPHAATAKESAVTTLASMLFLNRSGRFEPRTLPAEAQWTPVSAVSVTDVDGDGRPDLFLAQNLFAVRPEDSRLDAGRGLWLRGDGKGGFTVVPGQESGVVIYGEQRGAATGDLDSDGRPDLIVTQNGSTTRLFRNSGARKQP
jgi:hypothetical protein